jgi:hypothetical protein
MIHAKKSRYLGQPSQFGEAGPEPLQDAIPATPHRGRRRHVDEVRVGV